MIKSDIRAKRDSHLEDMREALTYFKSRWYKNDLRPIIPYLFTE